MKFSVYQGSEQSGRKNNEDRVGYVYTQEAAIFVVADGMGGHANGELAAQIVLECVTGLFDRFAKPLLPDLGEFLSEAMMQAHHQILQFSREQGMDDTPRTTLTMLVIQNGQAAWAHCGDTRLYWVRAGKLLKRTIDHSYAEQTPPGCDTKSDYFSHMVNRNVLYTCLGAPTKPLYDISPIVTLQAGDKFLLLSDGVWGCTDEAIIVEVLSFMPVTQSVPQLITLALKNGGIYGDNATGIGIEWKGI